MKRILMMLFLLPVAARAAIIPLHDPYAVHVDGTDALEGNWSLGGFNLTNGGVITSSSFVTGGDIGISGDTDLLQLAADTFTINGATNAVGDLSTLGITATSLKFNFTTQDYKFLNRNQEELCIQSDTSNTDPYVNIFTKDGDGAANENVAFYLWGKGTPSDVLTASERIGLVYSGAAGAQKCILASLAAGTGTVRPLHIYTGANTSQLVLATDGTVSMASDLTVNGTIAASTGSTIGNLTLADGSITDSGGTISLNDDHLSTSGNVTCAGVYNTGDSDTYFGFATDTIGFYTGGAKLVEQKYVGPLRYFKINPDGLDADTQISGDNVTALFYVDAGNDRIGINESTPQDTLEVNGTVLVKDKLKFTQDDGNEYIDSLADGYMDYGATTGHRFDASVSTAKQDDTLGAGATTFAVTSNVMTITGDGGGNTVATITGASSGTLLTLIFVDGNVTITDDDTHGADSVDLSAAFTSADDTTLQLVYDSVSWYEVSRSVN